MSKNLKAKMRVPQIVATIHKNKSPCDCCACKKLPGGKCKQIRQEDKVLSKKGTSSKLPPTDSNQVFSKPSKSQKLQDRPIRVKQLRSGKHGTKLSFKPRSTLILSDGSSSTFMGMDLILNSDYLETGGSDASSKNSYFRMPTSFTSTSSRKNANRTPRTTVDSALPQYSPGHMKLPNAISFADQWSTTNSAWSNLEGAEQSEVYLEMFIPRPCYKPLSIPTSTTTSSIETHDIERTLVLVKPFAMPFKDVILKVIFDHGFQLMDQRVVHLTPEHAAEIYSHAYGTAAFACLVLELSTAPVLALSISSRNAIMKWQNIIGMQSAVRREWFFPLSLRKQFDIQSIPFAMKTSENKKMSDKENRYFFPKPILEPVQEDLNKVTDYCDLYINKTLSKGLAEIVKRKPKEPLLYLANWLLANNPFTPRCPSILSCACRKYIDNVGPPKFLDSTCLKYANEIGYVK